ncbi:hypothetical protein JW933_04455 [candidate division FCPU426 bacterium]|nr:hypothetical protein [candidate division FCPU426 bacterium]
MRLRIFKRKPPVAERLLNMREAAGADPKKHEQYHKAVNRYQRIVVKAYYLRRRFPFLRWFFLWLVFICVPWA